MKFAEERQHDNGNVLIHYKPTKCTFCKLKFQFLCLLYVTHQRVHLQEDCCSYRYGIVCIYTVLPTRLLDLMHVHTSYALYHTCIYNRLPEDEPSGSKHVADTIN